MMEVWGTNVSDQGWSAELWCAARTLQDKGAMDTDLLSSVRLSDGGTVRSGVHSVIVIRYLLGRHVKRRDGSTWKESQM